MTTPDAMLPCPFCNGSAHIGTVTYSRPLEDVTWDDGSPVLKAYYGHCAVCAVGHRNGIAGGYPTEQAAFAAWNRRAGQAHAAALLEALRDQIDGCSMIVRLLSGQESSVTHSLRAMLNAQIDDARAAIAAVKGA
jgi:hypothetical protein